MVDPRLTLPASTAPGNALASVQPLAAIATLRPGSTLVATVLARLGDTRALLALGSRTVEVRTTTPLMQGETLQLEVTHAGRLLVLARRETREVTASSARNALHAQVREQLQRQLPQQRGLGEFFSGVGALARSLGSLPGSQAREAQRVMAQLPTRADVGTAEGLARALAWATSRPREATAERTLAQDLLALLRAVSASGATLASTSRGTVSAASPPPPLPGARPVPQGRVEARARNRAPVTGNVVREQALGVFARQELLALAGALPRAREQAALGAEIPVVSDDGQSVDVLAIRLSQPSQEATEDPVEHDASPAGRRASGEGHRWHVELAFDLPTLGPVLASLSLQAGHAVSVHLQADEPATNCRVVTSLAALTDGLRRRGLEVTQVSAASGGDCEGVSPLTRIVDERA